MSIIKGENKKMFGLKLFKNTKTKRAAAKKKNINSHSKGKTTKLNTKKATQIKRSELKTPTTTKKGIKKNTTVSKNTSTKKKSSSQSKTKK